jgi:hypothetical protein
MIVLLSSGGVKNRPKRSFIGIKPLIPGIVFLLTFSGRSSITNSGVARARTSVSARNKNHRDPVIVGTVVGQRFVLYPSQRQSRG